MVELELFLVEARVKQRGYVNRRDYSKKISIKVIIRQELKGIGMARLVKKHIQQISISGGTLLKF